MSNPKISDEEIDQALIANITHQWRKVARIVGMMMGQIDSERRAGLMDLYFAERVVLLVEKGFIEYEGDLGEMGNCEVRLPYDVTTEEKIKLSLLKDSKAFPPQNYQYRVVFKNGHLGIHGVYYDNSGNIRVMDIEPNVPLGYDLDDLPHKLELMLESLDKEILDYDKLKADTDKLNRIPYD